MPEKPLREKPSSSAPSSPLIGKGLRKSKKAPAAKRVAGKMRLKPKAVKSRTPKRPPKHTGPEIYPDQTGLRPSAPAADGYVRLRIHVDEDGESSIVDSHFVASTLVQASMLQGNYVYEVTEDNTRLHLESIPDLGVFRAFVNPDGPLEEHKHHMYELPAYDYDARVPVSKLVAAKLSKVAIKLYRVKDARAVMPVGCDTLDVQYQRELREVTRVEGIPAKTLPENVQRKISRK